MRIRYVGASLFAFVLTMSNASADDHVYWRFHLTEPLEVSDSDPAAPSDPYHPAAPTKPHGCAVAGTSMMGCASLGQYPGNYAWTVPDGVTSVRVALIGGGAPGQSGNNVGYGGSSGKLVVQEVSVSPQQVIQIQVAPSTANMSPAEWTSIQAASSTFGPLTAVGGYLPSQNTVPGTGGSGGQAYGRTGGEGGMAGSSGWIYGQGGGIGQGAWPDLSIFTHASLTPGYGGLGGDDGSGNLYAGAGGGGLMIDGAQTPYADDGTPGDAGAIMIIGQGGVGFGAGGGGGARTFAGENAQGGAGAQGIVYWEW